MVWAQKQKYRPMKQDRKPRNKPMHLWAWRNPLSERETWQATVYRVAETHTWPKWPCTHRCTTFFPVIALPQWELNVKVAQLLGLQRAWQRQVCRDTDCFCHRSYGPVRVFLHASCTWQSVGLFGQSFRHLEGSLAWVPSLLFCESGT